MATITRPETRQGMSVLTDALLGRCAGRAPGYDRDNTFFTEDFNELKEAGCLTLPVPEELGGGLLGFGNIHYGMARRALEITVDTVKRKIRSASRGRRPITPKCSMRWPRWRSSSPGQRLADARIRRQDRTRHQP